MFQPESNITYEFVECSLFFLKCRVNRQTERESEREIPYLEA